MATTFTWTPENKLASSTLPDGTVQTNTFGDDGLRRSKTVNGTLTVYTLDEMNVLLETDNSGAVQKRYTTNPGYYGGLSSQRRASSRPLGGSSPSRWRSQTMASNRSGSWPETPA